MILGMDFLSRLGKVTFGFNHSKLQLHGIGNEINLLKDYGTLGGKLQKYMQGFKK